MAKKQLPVNQRHDKYVIAKLQEIFIYLYDAKVSPTTALGIMAKNLAALTWALAEYYGEHKKDEKPMKLSLQ